MEQIQKEVDSFYQEHFGHSYSPQATVPGLNPFHFISLRGQIESAKTHAQLVVALAQEKQEKPEVRNMAGPVVAEALTRLAEKCSKCGGAGYEDGMDFGWSCPRCNADGESNAIPAYFAGLNERDIVELERVADYMAHRGDAGIEAVVRDIRTRLKFGLEGQVKASLRPAAPPATAAAPEAGEVGRNTVQALCNLHNYLSKFTDGLLTDDEVEEWRSCMNGQFDDTFDAGVAHGKAVVAEILRKSIRAAAALTTPAPPAAAEADTRYNKLYAQMVDLAARWQDGLDNPNWEQGTELLNILWDRFTPTTPCTPANCGSCPKKQEVQVAQGLPVEEGGESNG